MRPSPGWRSGKTSSVTGWKTGWLHARRDLIDAITAVKQYLTYANADPLQPAVARALQLPDERFSATAKTLQEGRDRMVEGLVEAGFTVSVPAGTYFVVADAAPMGFDDGDDGLARCLRLPELAGVVAFHNDVESARSLVRFAFCKRPEVLVEVVSRLRRLRPG